VYDDEWLMERMGHYVIKIRAGFSLLQGGGEREKAKKKSFAAPAAEH
jgi:hypothetical protein